MKLKNFLMATSLIISCSTTFAVSNLNSSKSNTPEVKSDTSAAEKECVASGGKIETAIDGKKVCVKPTSGTSMDSRTVKSSKSNTSE